MRRVFVGLVALVVLFALFVGGVALLDYTESTEFCTLCHRTMEPEAVTHQVTAHAEVDCGTCHIGEGVLWSIYYHVANARYAVTYPFGLYERPLETPRSTLRPAEAVCGQCHWEEANYGPRLVTLNKYSADEANTLAQVQLLVKTGSGQADMPGVGAGAHWHVANPVSYVAADEEAQEIPWVRAVVDGEVREYWASGAGPTPEAVAASDIDELDCMDCHSRAQHRIPPTEEAVDRAMAEGLLPTDLPYIKSVAVDVLEQRYETREAGYAAMDAVSDRYQSQYPDVFSSRQEDVERAVEGLRLLFSRTHFPYMNQYWDTYPDNVGHTYFPGCFRCHDGDHIGEDGQAIRAECNLCHSIPQVASGGALLPAVSLAFGDRPESHLSTLWIAEHRYRFDTSCAECHSVGNAGGADDSSFCSNSACHGREWKYLALNTERVLALSVPEREPAEVARPVPHLVAEDMVCELCHGLGQVLAYPEDHASYTRDLCVACHPVAEAKEEVTPEPTPVETPVEVATPTPEPTATAPVEVTPEATITATPGIAVTETPSATETAAPEETETPEVGETPTVE
ncbi:MAG: hypothetical protein HPY83_14095, partial [Anaerolineae bacterium]|nr:hypothetical protein [Anaerolineae bacterium]